MRTRRTKPYVCVDCDYAEHFRFQAAEDVDAVAGTWLRCLTYSRAQEQDGVVKVAWLKRTFATTYVRVEALIQVGLLRLREDGDYELHAYAPRNQTRAMIEDERQAARIRMSTRRSAEAEHRRSVLPNNRRTNGEHAPNTTGSSVVVGRDDSGSTMLHANAGSHSGEPTAALAAPGSSVALDAIMSTDAAMRVIAPEIASLAPVDVRANTHRTNDEQEANEQRTNALVPISISLSSSSVFLDLSLEDSSSGNGRAISRADAQAPAPARGERPSLPPSERLVSGSFWLEAFSEGISERTGRPCTVGRVYLGTLERIVTHHAPRRDAPNATAWLKDQAKAFAAQWDGKHPAKGLTPDGLERWLNEGRQGPPVFGRPQIVQPSAEQWHADDWSDLGARVSE